MSVRSSIRAGLGIVSISPNTITSQPWRTGGLPSNPPSLDLLGPFAPFNSASSTLINHLQYIHICLTRRVEKSNHMHVKLALRFNARLSEIMTDTRYGSFNDNNMQQIFEFFNPEVLTIFFNKNHSQVQILIQLYS